MSTDVAPTAAVPVAPVASSSPSSSARVPPPPPPAPYHLLGHEHLFNYFGLAKWSKAHLRHPVSTYYDAVLRDAGLPLVACGPVQVDGQPIERDPNSSLLA